MPRRHFGVMPKLLRNCDGPLHLLLPTPQHVIYKSMAPTGEKSEALHVSEVICEITETPMITGTSVSALHSVAYLQAMGIKDTPIPCVDVEVMHGKFVNINETMK